MKDFVVLVKPIITNDLKQGIGIELVNVNYLLQQLFKTEPSQLNLINQYKIDENSLRFETVNGQLCVVMLAFRVQ